MVRNHKRKTDRVTGAEVREQLKAAAKLVQEDGWAIRAAAKSAGVDRMTLTRFLKNGNKLGYEKCSEVRKVFNTEQEDALAQHIRALDDCFHGLSTVKCMTLAFEFANLNEITMPPSWTKNQRAGNMTSISGSSLVLVFVILRFLRTQY